MNDPNAKIKLRQYLLVGTAIVGTAVIAVALMFLFDGQPPPPRERPRTVNLTPPGSVDDKEVWRANEAARARATEKLIADIAGKVRAADEQAAKLGKEVEALKSDKAKAAAALPTPPSTGADPLADPLPTGGGARRVLDPPDAGSRLASAKGGAAAAKPINVSMVEAVAHSDSIEMISFASAASAQTASPGKPGASAMPAVAKGNGAPSGAEGARDDDTDGTEFIPAGSFVRVSMLNGIDAPTGGQAQSNPLPIAFHVLDTANLANRYRLDIQDCRIIGAAWGDLSSERTMARTETLTCIINGKAVEMQIKGQAIGEDGKAGIRGRLVTKQGQLLANALFAGSLSGIGRAFQSAATTTVAGGAGLTQTIDADKVAQAAIGGGVSSASSMLAQYYLKAADKLFPVIETDGGRTVEILITKGAILKGKAAHRDQGRGLLRRDGAMPRSDDDD